MAVCRGAHRWELLTSDSSSRATIDSPFEGLLNSIQAPVQPLHITNTCVQNLCSLSQDLICMNSPSIPLDPCSIHMLRIFTLLCLVSCWIDNHAVLHRTRMSVVGSQCVVWNPSCSTMLLFATSLL